MLLIKNSELYLHYNIMLFLIMENEIWKPVVGYEGYYEISNLGRLKSVDRMVKQGKSLRHVTERIKKPHRASDGYPAYTLCRDCKSKIIRIHLLLARAFIPNPENKGYVDHINTDINDFRLENLRWVTAKENSNNPLTLQHCRDNTYIKEVSQRANKTKIERGTKTAPKKVYQFLKDGTFVGEWECSNEAYKKTGIIASSIRDCCNGKRYSAGGYLWSYDENKTPIYNVPTHTNAKKVWQYDTNGNLIKVWDSYTKAAKSIGMLPSNFAKYAKKKPFQKGYIWKFNEEQLE